MTAEERLVAKGLLEKPVEPVIKKAKGKLVVKGGKGSGSWDGPGDPRYAYRFHEEDPRESPQGNRPNARVSKEKGKKVIITSKGDKLHQAVREPDTLGTNKKGEKIVIPGKLKMPDGSDIPKHVGYIPPAWSHVYVNKNPNGRLLAEGIDKKGKLQPKYNPVFAEKKGKEKQERVGKLNGNFGELYKKVDAEATKGVGATKEAASCLRLIMSTGIRPTDENDGPAADKKAYGAVTMLGQHVFVKGNKVHIELPAKKGTTYSADIDDTKIAADLIKRKNAAGKSGRIFDTTGDKILDYSKKTTGYKVKDYRTRVANDLAESIISNMPKPKTEKEYKASLKAVAEAVSAKLCNTPSMALKAYIDPKQFSKWMKSAGVKKKGIEDIEEAIILFEEE